VGVLRDIRSVGVGGSGEDLGGRVAVVEGRVGWIVWAVVSGLEGGEGEQDDSEIVRAQMIENRRAASF
jgi:hypothetical protein